MLRLGVDVGGTFTDFALHDDETESVRIFKCLTTPDDPSQAFLQGVTELLEGEGHLSQVDQCVHGTTLATNVLLERKGQGIALITTRGFRDILEIRRQKRYELYDHFMDTPVALVPRWLVREVTERMRYDGSVITPLHGEELDALITEFIDLNIQSVAICLLHAYANPEHEQAIAERIKTLAPHILISLSSDISPRFREYERTSTTVANAYVMPQVHRYLGHLVDAMHHRGFRHPLYMMQSNGGIATAETMRHYPVRMIESGPAAGVVMAAHLGKTLGVPDLMSFDMGGTTAKVCLIEEATPTITSEFEVDRARMKSGSGLPLSVPSVDLNEIGAGGGSLARPHMGIITVGPDSAGANPGPMCYGLGGVEPTVTDADLVLGYLNPDYFLGGSMPLDTSAAEHGIEEQIALPLGLDVVRAAWGIYQTVNANMARAARMVSVERGKDPRRFAFVAFGGAGPIHGIRIARELGIRRVILPAAAGIASALGLLSADIAFDFERTTVIGLDESAAEAANRLFRDMEELGRAQVQAATDDSVCELSRTASMRYVGQGHEIDVPVPGGVWTADLVAQARRAFDDAYALIYGYSDANADVEVVTWKVSASALTAPLTWPSPSASGGKLDDATKGARQAYFPEVGGFVECPVYDRYRLSTGMQVQGPSLVEERESTAIILPGDVAHVDDLGNLIIDAGPSIS